MLTAAFSSYSSLLPRDTDKVALNQRLSDLDRVERSSLAQVVGYHPEVKGVLDGRVDADAADIGLVSAWKRIDRHGVDVVGRIVGQLDSRGGGEQFAGSFDAEGRANCRFSDSEWPFCTGTRTQVAVTATLSSPSIFLVSSTILRSSFVYPSSRNTSICGRQLNAI